MFEFFSTISDAITFFVDFVGSIVHHFVTLIQLIPGCLNVFNMFTLYLPSELLYFALFTLIISLVYFFMGR